MISHDEQKALVFADIMNCNTGSWPIKYLGGPVLDSRVRVTEWIQVLEKLLKRLDGWQGSALSLGGRITFDQFMLKKYSTYCMSMYLLPKTILKRMDNIRKRFFWQGRGTKRKYYLTKWTKIAKPK
jgi:hypothetical protein